MVGLGSFEALRAREADGLGNFDIGQNMMSDPSFFAVNEGMEFGNVFDDFMADIGP
jgi:hypothetical protein